MRRLLLLVEWGATGAVFIFILAAISARGIEPSPATSTNGFWKTSASLGLTLTRGNSDTLLFTARIVTGEKTIKHELTLGAETSYGEVNNVKNNETIHGFGQYNHLFSEQFYGYAHLDALHDAIANIHYRVTFSPGVGYYFIKNAKTTLSGEAGPGAVMERQGSEDHSYATLRLAEKFTRQLGDRARFWQNIEFLPNLEQGADYVINAEIGLESGITKSTSLKVYVQDTYDNYPASGRKSNDVKLVSALTWTF